MKFWKLTARIATRRFWLRLIACVVLAVVVFVAGMRVYWRVQLKREIARIKAEGYPTTFEELNEFYPAVPDEDNMALILTNAFAKMDFELTDAERNLVPYLGTADDPTSIAPLNNRTAEAIDGVLSRNAEVFDLIRNATQKRTFRFADIPPPDDANSEFDPLSGIKRISSSLRLKTYRHLTKNEQAEAFESIRVLLRLSNALDSYPTLIAVIIRNAVASVAVDHLQFTMQNSQPSRANLENLREELEWILGESSFAHAFAGEFVYALHVGYHHRDKLDNYVGFSAIDDWTSMYELKQVFTYYNYRLCGRVDLDLALFLAELDAVAKAMRNEQLAFNYVRTGRSEFEASLPISGWYPISNGLHFDKTMTKLLTSTRRLAATEAALAVEQFRQRHGRLPEILEVLVPDYLNAVPTDFESGQPMRILGTTNGFGVGPGTPIFQVRTNFAEPLPEPTPTSAP